MWQNKLYYIIFLLHILVVANVIRNYIMNRIISSWQFTVCGFFVKLPDIRSKNLSCDYSFFFEPVFIQVIGNR